MNGIPHEKMLWRESSDEDFPVAVQYVTVHTLVAGFLVVV
jgi:hypothetical protein